MKFSHLIVLSVQNTVVNGGALSIKNCFPSFSSSSAINAQTLSGTGRGGRLLITIILIILLFFLSVCRAHVVRVATKTKRSEWRFYFFRFFSFSWPLTRRKRWKFGPRLACPLFSLKKKRETHHTTEVRRRTWIENEGTPRFFAIFFCVVSAHAVEKYISNGTISSIGTRSIRKRGYERTIFVVFARNFFWPF